jgi:hypothetical protein
MRNRLSSIVLHAIGAAPQKHGKARSGEDELHPKYLIKISF